MSAAAPGKPAPAWRPRDSIYSPAVRRLLPFLDTLPAYWGEDLLAGLCMVSGLVRPGRRRQAAAWARAQPGRRTVRLVAALCAFRGRWTARTCFLGLRRPEDLRARLVVEGESHLTARRGGAILLAFHVGPPGSDVALRLRGHHLTSLGWGNPPVRERKAKVWHPAFEPDQYWPIDRDWDRWPALLLRARRLLLAGGRVYMPADGGAGRELFSVPLPGRPAIIRTGWAALHRHSGAPVLPVTTRLERHTQVVTVHPPLPPLGPRDHDGLDACRATVSRLLEDYVRRHPEQCIGLAF